MTITLRMSGFDGSLAYEPASQKFPLTLEDLALAIITAGRSGWQNTTVGAKYRLWEIQALLLKTFAYVKQTQDGLRTTDLYRHLDKTEKGAASYRIGMGIAKIVAERKLGVPWLRHADPLIKQQVITCDSSLRPDMVGRSVGGKWQVVEAKGRSYRDSSAIRDALTQARAITSVAGQDPERKCACVATFQEAFDVDFQQERNKQTMATTVGKGPIPFFRAYYDLISDLENYRKPAQIHIKNTKNSLIDEVFQIFQLPTNDFAIGIHDRIYQILHENPSIVDFSDNGFIDLYREIISPSLFPSNKASTFVLNTQQTAPADRTPWELADQNQLHVFEFPFHSSPRTISIGSDGYLFMRISEKNDELDLLGGD